ncbi:MAG: M15 family metallopeptidase [Phormidesmis sp.]
MKPADSIFEKSPEQSSEQFSEQMSVPIASRVSSPSALPSSLPTSPQVSLQKLQKSPLKWPFAVVAATIAIAIVTGGLFLAYQVRKASASSDKALNDTRSPLTQEQAAADALTTITPLPATVLTPQTSSTSPPNAATAGTNAPYAFPSEESAYPQENLSVQPAAPVVADALAGASFGHLPYAEDDPARLAEIEPFEREGYRRTEQLDAEAAQAFTNMQTVARSQGIELMAISGYRTIADQKELFASQIERKGSEAAAAEYSAPPGHSEHHTGYALDIADASQPETDLKHSFENTPAYRWLLENAYMYGFEQSFPKNNVQGVSFEPWHWRYINSARAAKTFVTAKTAFPTP